MLLTAGILSFILGLVHSILGEVLIFKSLRKDEIIPSHGGKLLRPRQVRILWVSWHLVTLFGWALGVILCSVATLDSINHLDIIMKIITATMFLGALLVLIGTKGKHPGWIVLTAISVLSMTP